MLIVERVENCIANCYFRRFLQGPALNKPVDGRLDDVETQEIEPTIVQPSFLDTDDQVGHLVYLFLILNTPWTHQPSAMYSCLSGTVAKHNFKFISIKLKM